MLGNIPKKPDVPQDDRLQLCILFGQYWVQNQVGSQNKHENCRMCSPFKFQPVSLPRSPLFEQRIWLWNGSEITSVDDHCFFEYLLFIFLVSFFELNCLSDVSSTQHYMPIGKLWTCTIINLLLMSMSILQDLKARDEKI